MFASLPTKSVYSGLSIPESNGKLSEATRLYDKKLLAWLGYIYKMLNKDEMEEEEVTQALDMLENIKKSQDRRYLHNLIHPEAARDAKIPTSFPVPSSSFQLHASFLATTNATGNIAGYVNPLFLGNAANTTFFVNNNAGLTGSGVSNFFTGVEASQNIPANIYQRWRLVSYSMQVSYIGRMDIVSGVIGGGVTFDSSIATPQAVGIVDGLGARYGQFDLIDDSYYAYRTQAFNGLRVLYVPVDPSFEEYANVNTALIAEQLHFYGQGLPVSSTCLRIDTFANFECLADPSFQNFIPCSGVNPAPHQVKEAVSILTNTPNLVISSQEEYKAKKNGGFFSSIWSGLKSYVGTVMGLSKKAFDTIGGPVLRALIPGGKALSALSALPSPNMPMLEDMPD